MKLFIDIETVPAAKDFDSLDERSQDLFVTKMVRVEKYRDLTYQEIYPREAGLHAEFGKIVCVSMGYVQGEGIILKSFFGDDEKALLSEVAAALGKATSIVAHNGKNFDYPWLCRRMVIHKIPLPVLLQIQNLKPWEIKLEDTMEMWRFGQFNATASLDCLCHLFGLPSPKKGMDGSQVADVYYNECDLNKIVAYCEADITALVNVYRSMQYLEPIQTQLV
jgi:predicted PolB exonuclease-like 3'-5' exonuclease